MINWPNLTFPPINLWSYPVPDITMCLSHDCEKKESCYRYKAKPSEYRQSYAVFKKDGVKDCKHYEPLIQTVKEGEQYYYVRIGNSMCKAKFK